MVAMARPQAIAGPSRSMTLSASREKLGVNQIVDPEAIPTTQIINTVNVQLVKP